MNKKYLLMVTIAFTNMLFSMEQRYNKLVKLCQATDTRDVPTKRSLCREIVDMLLTEKEQKQFKQFTEIIKILPFDRQNLLSQELLKKKLLAFYTLYKGSIKPTELACPHTIFSAAFSHDGKKILISNDKRASLHTLATGPTTLFKGHKEAVLSVALGWDDKHALTGSCDATASLWSITEGKEIKKFLGHTAEVSAVALSPNGKCALTGSGDQTARLWSVKTGRMIKEFKANAKVCSVAYSPDNRYILIGSEDPAAILYDLHTESTKQLKGHTNAVLSVAFSADSEYALTGSKDQTARYWDLDTGRTIKELKGHNSYVTSVALSPNGNYALTGSWDETARLWDLNTVESVEIVKPHITVRVVAFDNDGSSLFIAGSKQVYYIPLIDQIMNKADLDQLLVKLQDMPSLESSNMRPIKNNPKPEVKPVAKIEKKLTLKEFTYIAAPFALAALSYGCFRFFKYLSRKPK